MKSANQINHVSRIVPVLSRTIRLPRALLSREVSRLRQFVSRILGALSPPILRPVPVRVPKPNPRSYRDHGATRDAW